MKEASSGAGVALLAVLCCGGVPLIAALAISVGAAAVLFGVAAVAGVVLLGFALLLLRRALLRRRAAACASPQGASHAPPAKVRG